MSYNVGEGYVNCYGCATEKEPQEGNEELLGIGKKIFSV